MMINILRVLIILMKESHVRDLLILILSKWLLMLKFVVLVEKILIADRSH